MKGRVADQFFQTWRELKKVKATDMCPTKKISTLKVDNKILGMLDEV
jgi:hypothetical protein